MGNTPEGQSRNVLIRRPDKGRRGFSDQPTASAGPRHGDNSRKQNQTQKKPDASSTGKTDLSSVKPTPPPQTAPAGQSAGRDTDLTGKPSFAGGGYDDYGRDRGPGVLGWVMIVLALFVIFAGILFGTYRYGLNAGFFDYSDTLKQKRALNARLLTDRIEAETLATAPWIVSADPLFVASRKIDSVSVTNANAIDHTNLGIYAEYALNDEAEASLHYMLAKIRDDQRAGVLLLPLRNNILAQQDTFDDLHKLNGGRGLLYLGQYYFFGATHLAEQLFIGDEDFQPRTTADSEPPIIPTNPAMAYRYFHMATLCNTPGAYQWRNQVSVSLGLYDQRESEAELDGQNALRDLVAMTGGTREAFCSGAFLQQRLDRLAPGMLIEQDGLMRLDALVDLLWSPDDRFQAFLEARKGAAGSAITQRSWQRGWTAASAMSDGSKYYRDSPGGGVPVTGTGSGYTGETDLPGRYQGTAYDNLPARCRVLDPPADCSARLDNLQCGDEARYYYNLGEAEMARGNIPAARANFSEAISVGRVCGSEYAVSSSKRLGALNLTCEYTAESLRRISRGAENRLDGGEVIDLTIRQRALKALGHYRETVDGRYGPKTREAVASFQREFGFRETGDLTPIQTVYLICGAAEIARDVNAYTALGLMYVTGLGVVQNTDLGLQWLKLAARDGDKDALYNLSIIYGSGTVLSSYVICDVVENEEQADAYLEEAARADHPIAERLVGRYGNLRTEERWRQIRLELGLDGDVTYRADDTQFERLLENVGYGCQPNPTSPPQYTP